MHIRLFFNLICYNVISLQFSYNGCLTAYHMLEIYPIYMCYLIIIIISKKMVLHVPTQMCIACYCFKL